MILGLGCDLVALPALAEQVGRPGSHFAEQVLTSRELRTVRARVKATTGDADGAGVSEAFVRHLGGHWAAKEAVIKAWSTSLASAPPPLDLDEVDWRQIEVVHDHWDRPSILLHGRLADEVAHSVDPDGLGIAWHVSISHDGDYAMAVVVLETSSFND